LLGENNLFLVEGELLLIADGIMEDK